MDGLAAWIANVVAMSFAAGLKVVLTNIPAIVESWHQASTSTASSPTPVTPDMQAKIEAEVKRELGR